MPTIGAEADGPLLEGATVRLRPLQRADLEAALPLAGDAAVAEMTARIPHPLSMADLESWFDELAASPSEQVFAIERRAGGAFMGAVGLIVISSAQHAAELGFWLGRPYWGHGHMAEAVRLVLGHAFGTLGLERVVAGAFVGNVRSLRLQRRIGMRETGRETRPAPARGGPREVIVYELTAEAWFAAAQRS